MCLEIHVASPILPGGSGCLGGSSRCQAWERAEPFLWGGFSRLLSRENGNHTCCALHTPYNPSSLSFTPLARSLGTHLHLSGMGEFTRACHHLAQVGVQETLVVTSLGLNFYHFWKVGLKSEFCFKLDNAMDKGKYRKSLFYAFKRSQCIIA